MTIAAWDGPFVAEHWAYRAEGGRNLIVSYKSDNIGFKDKVLRLTKKPRKSDRDSHVHVASNKSHSCLAAFHFTNNIIAPLLFPRSDLLLLGRLVSVTGPFLAELSTMCEPSRPHHRLGLEIDTNAKEAWLLPDLCCLPGINSSVMSIEIKPKSCVLASREHVRDEHADKSRVSRYAMMQYWKRKQGHVDHFSAYDPLDLFAHDKAKMRRAIRHLLLQPQNNLRIHVDGEAVVPHKDEGFLHRDNGVSSVLGRVLGDHVPTDEQLEGRLEGLLVDVLMHSQVWLPVRVCTLVCVYASAN
jgi:inositol-pentakisphosphate 2-kinase